MRISVIQNFEAMETPIKTITLDILEGKYTVQELQNLVQLIAQEINLKTTTNYAKENGLSFNGVKNHRDYITIDGVKFHAKGIINNGLPF